MKKILLLITVSLLFSGNAFALTNKTFLQYKKSTKLEQKEVKDMVNAYVLGAANSYLSANAKLQLKGENKLYCQPGDLSLNLDNFLVFIEEQLIIEKKNNTYIAEMPLALTLLKRLIKVFPC